MTFPSHARCVHVLSFATLLLVLPFAACLRDPDVAKMMCTKDCPTGFVCVNPDPSGPHGRCHLITANGPAMDASGLAGDGATPSGMDAVSPDGIRLDVVGLDGARSEAGSVGSFDTPGIDGPPDQPLEAGPAVSDARETGGQGGIAGSGGASGLGGISGTGGVVAWDGGGVDVGVDVPLSGSGGMLAGGSTGTGGATGPGGATGNRDAASGGALGSGGDTGPTDVSIGTGGAPGTGGVPGTGGAGTGGMPGTGGSGTGGSGTGGSGTGGSTLPVVRVQVDQTHQTIEGFGLNTALSTGTIPWDTLFSTSGSGLGLSLVRVAMNPNGSLSGDVSGAKSHGAKIIGSTWSPPASCKDNNRTAAGGHLLPSCYTSWSTTIANFAKAQGLYAMSAASEPDFASCASIGPPCTDDYDSTVYSAKEMVAFVKELEYKLHAEGIKLIAPETQEWNHLWSNTSATGSTVASHPNSSDPLKCGCFGTSTSCAAACQNGDGYDYGHWLANDATAWAAVDIIGVHEYHTQRAEPWPSDVPQTKPVWMTEMSGLMYWPEAGPSSDMNNGLAVAGWIHSALVVGDASAWFWWWYQQIYLNDNEGLLLKGGTTPTKRYYTLGNYSKFVRPGYTRVEVTGNSNPNLLLSAYTSPDGTVVVVAINKGTAAATVSLAVSGGAAPASLVPWVTSADDDLVAKPAVTATAGSFTATLDGMTVTTFVGQ